MSVDLLLCDLRNAVPPMTDPLGRHWRQPPRERIAIDDTHALMDRATLEALPEYSRTVPTGVYPGKMWRAHAGDGCWLLRWWGLCDDPAKCSCNEREILVAEA